jgi:hypothetical protein
MTLTRDHPYQTPHATPHAMIDIEKSNEARLRLNSVPDYTRLSPMILRQELLFRLSWLHHIDTRLSTLVTWSRYCGEMGCVVGWFVLNWDRGESSGYGTYSSVPDAMHGGWIWSLNWSEDSAVSYAIWGQSEKKSRLTEKKSTINWRATTATKMRFWLPNSRGEYST